MVFWSGVFSILFLKFNSKSSVWFLGGLHTENQNCHIVCKSVWNRRWVNIVSFFGNKNLATWAWVLLKFQVAPILCGLTFSSAFVHRVHFYGKGLGKTFRIIELAGLKIFKLKIFIETFGSTLLSVFLWPVWLNHAHSGCFSLHKFDVKVLYDCLNWWQFLVCKVLKYLSKVVLHTCRAQNNFRMVSGHNHRQKKFLLSHLIFWTGQKLGKKVN